MAAGNWISHDNFKGYIGDGTIDWNANTLKVALVTSAYTPSLLHDTWSDISANEVANGNGYTTGGVTCAGTVTVSGSTTTYDIADAAWTASGGSIVARYAVLYALGTLNGVVNPVIGRCLLDTTPADVTVTDTNTLTIQIHANGIFQLSGATS